MKKVLIIAYYFPPIGGSGTQRPVKFVKYLPDFGWQPYVITTDKPYGHAAKSAESRDETLLADIPSDVQVWRIPTPQPKPVQRLARWLRWQPAKAPAPVYASANDYTTTTEASLPFTTRLRRLLLSPLYLVEQPPVDPALYWALRIVPMARRLIRQEKIDLIMTTVPPWSPLLTGSLLQRLTGRPWVADFRDPWTDDKFIYFPTPRQRQLDQHLERTLLNQADAIISVTQPVLDGLRQKTSSPNKPFALIPNGWDQDDFPQLAAIRAGLPLLGSHDNLIVLRHPGSAYQGEPLPLLWALAHLEPALSQRLRFHLIGYVHPQDRAEIENSPYAERFVLEEERVSHPEALRLMREAHVLLLLRKGLDASSGKIFEYMVSGRPVLTIGAKEGVAAGLVRETGIGCVADPDEIDNLTRMLQRIVVDYEGFVDEYYQPNWNAIAVYERRNLTNHLVKLLNQVIITSMNQVIV